MCAHLPITLDNRLTANSKNIFKGENMTYQEFINNILSTRGRFECQDKYHERHHIIPKCLGGTNDEENLIDLYANEHYIAHELLALENPHNKGLQYALWTMSRCTKVQNNDRYIPTEEQYKNAREAFSKAMSGENSPSYGKKMTNEQKQRLSESLKKSPAHRKHLEEMWENNRGKPAHNKGISPSEESIQKMKEYRNSKEFKLKVSKKISKYTMDGNFVCTYDSIVDAAKDMGGNANNISRVLCGRRSSYKGFLWKYASNETEIQPYEKYDNSKAVYKIDKTTNQILSKYSSIAEAAKSVNGNASCISSVCNPNMRAKSYKGYIWKYTTDVDAHFVDEDCDENEEDE